jgi:hypothetical protein
MKIRTKMALTASTSPVIAKPWKSDFLSAISKADYHGTIRSYKGIIRDFADEVLSAVDSRH